MKKIGFVAATVLVMTMLVIGCAQPAPAPAPAPAPSPAPAPETFEFLFAVPLSETHDISKSFQIFMERTTERTNGQVTWRTSYGGAMGGMKEVLALVREGTIDVTLLGYTYYPGLFPLSSVGLLPYTGFNLDARTAAYLQLNQELPEIAAEHAAHNIKVLYPTPGNAQALWTKKRIDTLDDLKGLKVRAAGLDAVVLKAWGAAPVSIAFGEVYDAMQRGVIDAAYGLSPQSGVSTGVFELSDFAINVRAGPTVLTSIPINLDSYNSLPPDIQKIFDEEGKNVADQYSAIRFEAMKAAIVKSKEAGLEVYAISDTLAAELEALGKDVVFERWVEEAVAAGFTEARAREILARFAELYKQFEPDSFWVQFHEVS